VSASPVLRTHLFPIEVTEEDDGRWSAVCPSLPGCATWAHTRADALRNMREAIEAYVDDMVRAGDPLPADVRVLDAPTVSVTV
jgi:predicted RNase H-like HicB family nuclease